jgi:tetratricopeptide (TPR) repeat protein
VTKAGQAPTSQVVVRPRDAVQWALYYPPVLNIRPEDFPAGGKRAWQDTVRQSIRFFNKGDLSKAFSSIPKNLHSISDPRFFVYHAGLLLTVGRVDKAEENIQRALALDPIVADAFALQSTIAVVQNEREKALELAEKAVQTNPTASTGHVARSYAYQARFDLENALKSLEKAVKVDPENALVWARLSEIRLSLGYLESSAQAAKRAVALKPNLARTQTVLGFAELTRININSSRMAFEKAIRIDSASPLARLGLGLAKIRNGDLKEGRGEIEIAAGLASNNALIRSYLGKAYFDERRESLASKQYEMAKSLDPNDPTAYFYDAILKQTTNRPVEALKDIKQSIALNDNRAVFRSRLKLDEDLAARSASLGRIYSDLGFQQLALVEGWKALNTDPSNFSAHRFLADSYFALPRHEIARVSELLQSQLLQPLNVTPIQPQIGDANLLTIETSGPGEPGFNEFNPLFLRDRFALQASGIVGENDTLGDELAHSAVLGKWSYNLGQFHYQTDGYRENNDLQENILTGFVQWRPTHSTGVQVEYRYTERDRGDLALRYDPTDFSSYFKENESSDSIRFGFQHSFSPHTDIIGSFIYQWADVDQEDQKAVVDLPNSSQRTVLDRNGFIAEFQHLYRSERFKLTSGIGHYDQKVDAVTTVNTFVTDEIKDPIFPWISIPVTIPIQLPPINFSSDNRYSNLYSYAQVNLLPDFTLTTGLTLDTFKFEGESSQNQINPKLGLTWSPWRQTTVRMALTRVLSRTLRFNQTIEPTQVAGFNQFYDDILGSDVWRYGAAIDQQISSDFYLGGEFSERDLSVPRRAPTFEAIFEDWEEQFARAYVYWTPLPMWACSAEYQYEYYDRSEGSANPDFNGGIVDVTTHRLPLRVNFFHPSGFSAGLQASYIHQSGTFSKEGIAAEGEVPPTILFSDRDDFWVFDASIRYRLPKRWGIVTLGVKNLFDEKFNFQDTDPEVPHIVPERFIFGKLTLAF